MVQSFPPTEHNLNMMRIGRSAYLFTFRLVNLFLLVSEDHEHGGGGDGSGGGDPPPQMGRATHRSALESHGRFLGSGGGRGGGWGKNSPANE